MLFLKNKVQLKNKYMYGMMLFMSKQVSLTKIMSILPKKRKIGPKSDILYALFALVIIFLSVTLSLHQAERASHHEVTHLRMCDMGLFET